MSELRLSSSAAPGLSRLLRIGLALPSGVVTALLAPPCFRLLSKSLPVPHGALFFHSWALGMEDLDRYLAGRRFEVEREAVGFRVNPSGDVAIRNPPPYHQAYLMRSGSGSDRAFLCRA